MRAFLGNIAKRTRGFTLIELLVVMAIVAALAAIVASATTGQSAKGGRASSREDGNSSKISAEAFNTDQAAETLTTETVTLTTTVSGNAVTAVEQEISSQWPEDFITENLTSTASIATRPYTLEFPDAESDTGTSGPSKDTIVTDITLLDSDGTPVSGFSLADHTAMVFSSLLSGGYVDKEPSSVSATTTINGVDFHRFLWLLKKASTAGESNTDDRTLKIYELTGSTIDTGPSPDEVTLTYTQIQ